jgi:hypothetical protein
VIEFESAVSNWRQLGETSPFDLVEQRLQLHWAVQIASAPARALLEARSDDSHTNLEWLSAGRMLAGHPLEKLHQMRSAVTCHSLTTG